MKAPASISLAIWQASITGIRRHVVAANSLVRIQNRCCLLQIANFSSKPQVVYSGQYLAVADLYDDRDDVDHAVHSFSSTSPSPISTSALIPLSLPMCLL